MADFPRIRKRLQSADRRSGAVSIALGLTATAYIVIAPLTESLPQPETVGSVVLGLIALVLIGMGARWLLTAGKIEGHTNLEHLRDPAQLAQLESELGSEVETWGELSFTRSFLLAPDFVPIPLDEVVWSYRREIQKAVSGAEVRSELWVYLASGEAEKFVADASDIEPAFDCIAERRPRTKLGYDPVTHDQWKLDSKATAERLRRAGPGA